MAHVKKGSYSTSGRADIGMLNVGSKVNVKKTTKTLRSRLSGCSQTVYKTL